MRKKEIEIRKSKPFLWNGQKLKRGYFGGEVIREGEDAGAS